MRIRKIDPIERIKSEIINSYDLKNNVEAKKILSDKFIEDCAKISAFLTNRERMMDELKSLNQELKNEYEKEFGIFDINEKYDVKESENQKPQIKFKNYQKGETAILRKFLENKLSESGLEKGFAQVFDQLDMAAFGELISSGYPFKDSEFRVDKHNEFSHALQLYIIIKNAKTIGLKVEEIINIYKKIGTILPELTPHLKNNEPNLWTILFDKPDFIFDEKIEFRSPENFTEIFLKHCNDKDLTLLIYLYNFRYLNNEDKGMLRDHFAKKMQHNQYVATIENLKNNIKDVYDYQDKKINNESFKIKYSSKWIKSHPNILLPLDTSIHRFIEKLDAKLLEKSINKVSLLIDITTCFKLENRLLFLDKFSDKFLNILISNSNDNLMPILFKKSARIENLFKILEILPKEMHVNIIDRIENNFLLEMYNTKKFYNCPLIKNNEEIQNLLSNITELNSNTHKHKGNK